MLKRIFIATFCLAFTTSCGIISVTKSSSSPADRYGRYNEDLTSSMVTFDPIPSTTAIANNTTVGGSAKPVDDDLSIAVQNFIREKESENFFNGFTILVYSGVDREEAFKTRNKLYSQYSDINTFMQYQQPRYLVKVGTYVNRIEALAWYEKISEEFPSARIIQDRFERKSMNENQEGSQDAR